MSAQQSTSSVFRFVMGPAFARLSFSRDAARTVSGVTIQRASGDPVQRWPLHWLPRMSDHLSSRSALIQRQPRVRPRSVHCSADSAFCLTSDVWQQAANLSCSASPGPCNIAPKQFEIDPSIVNEKEGFSLLCIPIVGHFALDGMHSNMHERHGYTEGDRGPRRSELTNNAVEANLSSSRFVILNGLTRQLSLWQNTSEESRFSPNRELLNLVEIDVVLVDVIVQWTNFSTNNTSVKRKGDCKCS